MTETPNPIPHRLRQPHSNYVAEAAADYIEKLEADLLIAEQALALRGEPVATNRILFVSDPFCPCCGHNRDTSSVSSIDLGGTEHECQICRANWAEIDPLTPLYAAPISGETAQHQISTQRALTEQAWNRQKKDQDDINDLLTRLGLSEDQFRTDGYWLNVPKILTLLREKAVSGERVRPDHSGIYPRTAAASTVCACGVMVPQNICNGIESDLVDTEAMPISGERATKPFAYALIHNENTERMLMWDKPTVRSGVYREDMDWIPLYTHAVSGERVANEKRKGERRIDYSKAGMLNRDCKDRRRYIAPSGERVREALQAFIDIDDDVGLFVCAAHAAPALVQALNLGRAALALPLAAQPEGK